MTLGETDAAVFFFCTFTNNQHTQPPLPSRLWSSLAVVDVMEIKVCKEVEAMDKKLAAHPEYKIYVDLSAFDAKKTEQGRKG